MWPFLPKKCDCSTTPTNPVTICNENALVTNDFVYNGANSTCMDVQHNDTLTTIIQKYDYYLCSGNFATQILTTIQNNIELFPNFTTLVNGSIDCETISACGPSTTTTTTTIPITTTTTTTCHFNNLVLNGTFNESLVGWNQSIFGSWEWSPNHGGSALYSGLDENSILYQSILTIGVTYDISFNLWQLNPCTSPNLFYVKVFAGTQEYGPIHISGNEIINLTLTCTGNSLFGIQGYDACGAPLNSIYIKDVVVSKHCPQFTTTSTSTSSTTSTTSTTSSSTTTTTTTLPITTTTTTTLAGCINLIFNANVAGEGTPGHATITYSDCSGEIIITTIPLGEIQTYCTSGYGIFPEYLTGNGTITMGSPCSLS